MYSEFTYRIFNSWNELCIISPINYSISYHIVTRKLGIF